MYIPFVRVDDISTLMPVLLDKFKQKYFNILLRYKLRSRNWATLLPVTNYKSVGITFPPKLYSIDEVIVNLYHININRN
jgi:hypothetical protein